MTDWNAFINMGGYAGFVWPAYFVTGLVLVALAVVSLAASRRRTVELKKLQEQSPHRQHRRMTEALDEASNGI